MRTTTQKHWIMVLLFAALCIAAIAADCSAGDAAVWVAELSTRLDAHLDGELAGVTFDLRVDLHSPMLVGLTVGHRRPMISSWLGIQNAVVNRQAACSRGTRS